MYVNEELRSAVGTLYVISTVRCLLLCPGPLTPEPRKGDRKSLFRASGGGPPAPPHPPGNAGPQRKAVVPRGGEAAPGPFGGRLRGAGRAGALRGRRGVGRPALRWWAESRGGYRAKGRPRGSPDAPRGAGGVRACVRKGMSLPGRRLGWPRTSALCRSSFEGETDGRYFVANQINTKDVLSHNLCNLLFSSSLIPRCSVALPGALVCRRSPRDWPALVPPGAGVTPR